MGRRTPASTIDKTWEVFEEAIKRNVALKAADSNVDKKTETNVDKKIETNVDSKEKTSTDDEPVKSNKEKKKEKKKLKKNMAENESTKDKTENGAVDSKEEASVNQVRY